MRRGIVVAAAVAILPAASHYRPNAEAELSFAVSFPAELSADALDGRLLLLISNDPRSEPRFQINDNANTQIVFGIDVDGLPPGAEATIDAEVLGYPIRSLDELPPGRYHVQVLLNRYETFRRSDGHVVKLPPDRGEGQQWNRKPGNLYSAPMEMELDPSWSRTIHLVLDREIPSIAPPADTKYIKHERMQSDLLTEFWGRPVEIGANVLLPEGFDEHSDARYPLVVNHGHFPYTFGGFRQEPPDPDLEPDYAARFRLEGYNRIQPKAPRNFQ